MLPWDMPAAVGFAWVPLGCARRGRCGTGTRFDGMAGDPPVCGVAECTVDSLQALCPCPRPPARGVEAPFAFPMIDRFSMALLYAGARRALNGLKRRFPAWVDAESMSAVCSLTLGVGIILDHTLSCLCSNIVLSAQC
jgi:hypothetical protein